MIMSQIEDQADSQGKGSVWRACLAISRSSKNKALSGLIMELAYSYCTGRNTIKHLHNICNDHINETEGEEHQGFIALQNAISDIPMKNVSDLEDRKGLWLRLDRLVK